MQMINDQLRVITALRRRFDLVPLELEFRIWHLLDPEDVESLYDDLKLCQSIEEVERCVTWREGRHSGRIDGMRSAILTILGFEDHPIIDQIADQAFNSHDLGELEELLFRAADARIRFQFSVN